MAIWTLRIEFTVNIRDSRLVDHICTSSGNETGLSSSREE